LQKRWSKKGNASCRERPVPLQHAKACGDKLAAELERVTLGDMQIPVVTNVTAEYIIDKDKVKDLLIRQVSSSVLFEDSIRNMIEDGWILLLR